MSEHAVVIPTCRRPALLARCLGHLAEQTARGVPAQVVVVEDGACPENAPALEAARRRGLPLVHVVHETPRGPAAARNAGVARVTAPVTVLIDDDVLLAPDALERLCEVGLPARDASFSLLGFVTWHPAEPVGPFMYWQEHGGAQFDYDGIPDHWDAGWRFYGTSFVATNTALLRRVPFDEGFPLARYEDMELGWRLERDHGHRVRFIRRAVAWHVHPVTLGEWLAKVSRFAAPATRFARGAGDPRVGETIGVEAARRLKSFVWADLVRAAALIGELEARVPVPPQATEVYGQLWEWECLATAYRVLQNFFFTTALRDEMGLAPLRALDATLESTEACRRLLERVAGAAGRRPEVAG
jgi:GT2 family glycosyltransferase